MTIRIFISSPGDVAQERQIARRVIERLSAECGQPVSLEPYFWEYEPVTITKSYQEQIPAPSGFDIVICILWSRLGSRLNSRYTLPPDHVRVARSGTEYEMVDAVEGRRQHGAPDILVWLNKTEPQVPLTAADRDERIRQWEQLQSFLKEWTRDAKEQVFSGAVNSYRTKDDFEEKFEVKLRKLIAARAGQLEHSPGPAWLGNPYRGLEAFEYEHDSVFFGRTAAVDAVIGIARNRLKAVWSRSTETSPTEAFPDAQARAFVLILGGSGSGKSSLVRAGVVPMLVKGNVIEGVGLWRRAVMKPSDGHGNLFLALASALAKESALPELFSDGCTPAQLAKDLRANPAEIAGLVKGGLSQAAAQLLLEEQSNLRSAIEQERKAGRSNDVEALTQRMAGLKQRRACLVIVLDQLEEIFTGETHKGEIEAFLGAVDLLAGDGHVLVLATLRSDFFSHCENYAILMRLKAEEGTLHLVPPRRHELAQMIRGPAQRAGVRFEERADLGRLDEFLVDASASDCDSLPLLELCLYQLFEHGKEDGLLGFNEYEEIGRIEGLISRQAENVFASVSPMAQGALDGMIRSLTTISEGSGKDHRSAFVRRVVLYDELVGPPGARELVDALIAARLFSTGEDAAGRATVGVAHEAMLRQWNRVRDWLAAETNQRFLRVRAQVAQRLRQWDQSRQDSRDGRPDPSFLLQAGRELSAAEEQLGLHPTSFSHEEREFIETSMAERRRRQHRARNVRNAVSVALLALASFSIAAAVVASRQKREAVAAQNVAEKNLQIAIEMVDRLGFNSAEHRRMLVPTETIVQEMARTDEELSKLASQVQAVPLKVHQLEFLTGASTTFLDVGQIGKAVEFGRRAVALANQMQWDGKAATGIQSKDAQARLVYAQALLAAGQPKAATDAFGEAKTLTNEPGVRVLSRLGLARAAMVRLQPVEAQNQLREIRKESDEVQHPDDDALSWKALACCLEARAIASLKIDPPDQREQSRRRFDEAATILHDLIGRDSANLRWRRLSAEFFDLRGQVASSRGEREEARRAVEESRSAIEELCGHDRNNLDWRLGRARALLNAGGIAGDDGEWPQAIRNISDASAEIFTVLSAEPQTFDARQAQLSIFYEQSRSAAHEGPIRETEAYQKMSAMAEQYVKDMPDCLIFAYDTGIGSWYQASEHTKAGKYEEGLALNRQTVKVMEALRQVGCTDSRVVELEVYARSSIAKILIAQKKLADAISAYSDAVALLQKIMGPRPSGSQCELLASIDIELGDACAANAQLTRADEAYKQAGEAYDRQRQADPPEPDWFGNKALTQARRADLLLKRGNRPDSLNLLEESVTTLIEGISKDPSNNRLKELLNSDVQSAQKLEAALKAGPPKETEPALRRIASLRKKADTATDLIPEGFQKEQSMLVAQKAQGWSIPPLMPSAWRTLDAAEQKAEVAPLGTLDKRISSQHLLHIRSTRLEFYDDALLYEAEVQLDSGGIAILEYIRHGPERVVLPGKSDVIRDLNKRLPLRIDTVERATQYLRFFTSAIATDEGNFSLVDQADDIHWLGEAPEDTRQKVGRLCRPLIVEAATGGDWSATGTVQYSNALFYARFRVPRGGVVEMFGDAPVAADLRLLTQTFVDGLRVLKPTGPATQPATRP